MSNQHAVILILGLAFAICRFGVDSKKPDFSPIGILKVLAHFFVAGLAGYSLGTGDWFPVIVAAALTAVEVFAFVTIPHGEDHEKD